MLKRLMNFGLVCVAAVGLLTLGGCNDDNKSSSNTANPASTIRLLSGSENKSLEPILVDAAKQAGYDLKVDYKGSVDILRELEKGKGTDYDAVMPADRMWITLGDTQRVVKNVASIYRSPVVFGVKKSVAERLGWTKGEVHVADILKAAQSGKLRFMMTSATQSNSGAAAYFGFLYAFAGNPDVLSSADLDKPEVASKIKSILGSVNRTAGSSGWLKDLFIDRYDYFDAMVNYEALVIETNQKLISQNREPLYAVYPVDGLTIADAPLGFINKGDAAKEAGFLKMQQVLLSPAVQQQLLASGRRTGLGATVSGADQNVFNPTLGIDVNRVLTPITMPAADTIQKALTLYQTAFRKPRLTVFVLDFSGSMNGHGDDDLKNGMRIILDQQLAAKYLLQASPKDVAIVVPFDSAPRWLKKTEGNNADNLINLWSQVNAEVANGGTDFYTSITMTLPEIKKYQFENYSTSVVLMTDGQSDGSFDNLTSSMNAAGLGNIPIYSIMFGDADPSQLNRLAKFSGGKVFDGRKDLVSALREAFGYN